MKEEVKADEEQEREGGASYKRGEKEQGEKEFGEQEENEEQWYRRQ